MDTKQTIKLLEAGTGYEEQAIQPVTPMSLLERAVANGAPIETLERLLDLRLKWEANEARKAYFEAMAAFKAEVPQIVKDRTASFTGRGGGAVSYDYASLDNICEKLIPVLSKHGLSHNWRTSQLETGKIRVTCVISHALGHSQDGSTLEAAPDDSGTKNPIQAIGSTTSYLCKYTFCSTSGVAIKGHDTDANAAPEMDTLQIHLDRIVASENMKQLDNAFKDAFKEATSLKNTKAMLAIMTAKDNRKKELQKDEPDAKVPA
jgi:hypothetical protein